MIRPASAHDVEQVVPLIIQAMGTLAKKLTHVEDQTTINKIFKHFFQQLNNQYSYENILVYEEDGKVIGSLNAYDGGNLEKLRKPFLAYIAEHYGANSLDQDAETQDGEFYLDSISIHPIAQGKGIGTQLIEAGINWGKKLGYDTTGLLVEQNNANALKLYKKMGFVIENEKYFMGGWYHHMVFKAKK